MFRKKYDIIVAGGGIAGAAAALAAARSGAHVALVEKTVILGGLATSGLVWVYLPLCNGMGQQVIAGIAEEFLHLSLKYGPGEISPQWRDAASRARYRAVFSPASLALALDEVLSEAGVDIWLDTLVCDAVVKKNRLVGMEVENKSGRGLLQCACAVDATGDADVAFRAGARCVKGRNWMSIWALQASLEQAKQAVAKNDGSILLNGVCVGASDSGSGHPAGMKTFDGTDGRQVSAFVLTGRRLLRAWFADKQRQIPGGRKAVFPLTLPCMPQFRTTRRICGWQRLRFRDRDRDRHDRVALIPDWRQPGPIWAVPYGALVPKNIQGLLVAGRCIDTDQKAWNVARVIPCAALTGEAAGTAAALAIKMRTAPAELPPEIVRQTMREKGNIVDFVTLNATRGGR